MFTTPDGIGLLVFQIVQLITRHDQHTPVIVHKEVVGLTSETHRLQFSPHVVDKLLGHQVNTGYLFFILHPQVVLLVKIQMGVSCIIWQFVDVLLQGVNMLE